MALLEETGSMSAHRQDHRYPAQLARASSRLTGAVIRQFLRELSGISNVVTGGAR